MTTVYRRGTPFSPRQRAIADLVAKGHGNKAIAEALNSTVGTVKHHLSIALIKAGCRNRTELAIWMLTGATR